MQSQDWNRGGGKAKVGFAQSGPGVPDWYEEWHKRRPKGEERPFQTFEDTRPEMREMWQGGMGGAQAGAAGAGARFGQSRGYMEEGLGMYRDMMDDPSKSVAQQQMQAGMEQNLANQIQAQSAGRGGSMAGAQNLASGQAAGLGTAMNQQAAQLRAQEYQAALGGYSGLAGQMAGMDLQQQGQLGQLGLGYGQMGTDWELGIREQMEQEKENRWQRGMGLAGGIGGAVEGIGAAIGMSDVNAKQNIRPAGSGLERALAEAGELNAQMGRRPDFGGGSAAGRAYEGPTAVSAEPPPRPAPISPELRTADPFEEYYATGRVVDPFEEEAALALGRTPAYEFEYKPGYGPAGQRSGTMAQDLQKEPALAGMVVDTPDGLGVDTAQASSTALAASAQQQREIEKLKDEIDRMRGEAGKGEKKKEKKPEGLAGLGAGIRKGFGG